MSHTRLWYILFALLAILSTASASAGPVPNSLGPVPTLARTPAGSNAQLGDRLVKNNAQTFLPGAPGPRVNGMNDLSPVETGQDGRRVEVWHPILPVSTPGFPGALAVPDHPGQ
jgi:hypothetical protein